MRNRLFSILMLGLVVLTVSPALAGSHLAINFTPDRHAYYRGEDIRPVVSYFNESRDSRQNCSLILKMGDVLISSMTLPQIAGGQRWQRMFRIPTGNLKSGQYPDLVAVLRAGNTDLSASHAQVAIAGKPNPDRLMVWLWGGGGGEWYMKHGFTSWSGIGWNQASSKSETYVPDLDKALLNGGECSVSPNGGLREVDVSKASDPDMKYDGLLAPENVANPFNPEVARIQDDANRRLMEIVKDFPQIQTAFFNTEIVDDMKLNRNKAGIRLMNDTLGFVDTETGRPKFVAPGVLADDDRGYLLHKYIYKGGTGLGLANKRAVDMIHKYRKDILTFTDPYRETALLDIFPYVDVVETWTYTNPDPKLMLYAETLRAACKPTGQLWCNVVTMLNYPGELDPTDSWLLMDPGRTTVTSWINLSRAPKIIGYYYSSACPPSDKDSYEIPYATSQVIKDMADNVYKPYGPMITNLENAPRRIAVLSSVASRLYGKSPELLGGYNNMQIYHFYSLLAMAHLQADVVFDETIERFGLDDYDVLVLPKCDVLTKSCYDRILDFQKRGGIVIADQYLGADLPGAIRFDFDFTYRNKVTANAIARNLAYTNWNDHLEPGTAQFETVTGVTAMDDQKTMESYTAKLKDGLKGKVEPNVDCDKPTVLMNMLQNNGVRYLVVINDKRTYDDRVGKYKSVLGKMLPQSATISMKVSDFPNLYAYDMLERKALHLRKSEGRYLFDVDLTELGGKIIALYPDKIASLYVNTPSVLRPGVPSPIAISIRSSGKSPLPGLQPVQVIITDPKGAVNEYSDYYCAKNGSLGIPFLPALNDERGYWKISVTDLTSGLKARGAFLLTE